MARRRLPAPLPARAVFVSVDGSTVVVVATIQGLEGEAAHVQAAWESLQARGHAPSAIALGVPVEDTANLARIGASGVDAFLAEAEFDTGSYEENLLPHLARFGDVAIPPDDLLLAEELARSHGIPLVAVDLDDDTHADLFTAHIGGMQLLRSQVRMRKLVGGGLDDATTPEELALLWNHAFRDIKGYGAVEAAREEAMADGIRAQLLVHGPGCSLLAVIPYANAMGVVERLGA